MYSDTEGRTGQHRTQVGLTLRPLPGSGAYTLADALSKGFVILVLLLFAGGLLPLLRGGQLSNYPTDPNFINSTQTEDTTIRLVWLGIYVAILVLSFFRWRQFIDIVISNGKLLLLLVGIASTSVLWSVEPEVTLRQSVGLICTTLFGVYIAVRYDLGQQLRLLAWTLGIAALLSLVFALALPSYGFFDEGGGRGETWLGIYEHKNALGRIMVLGALVF